MNDRERLRETLRFGHPDKVPLEPGGPRESTLEVWHQQGLSEGAEWKTALWDILHIPAEPARHYCDLGVTFKMIPTFEERVLEHRDGHLVVQDWMGAVVEISDKYDYTYLREAKDFVTRKWHSFPVQTRTDWEEKLVWRYDPHHPERFPADFEERCRRLRDRETILRLDLPGPFWQLREWCGLERLCLLMIEQPNFVQEMAEFWMDFPTDAWTHPRACRVGSGADQRGHGLQAARHDLAQNDPALFDARLEKVDRRAQGRRLRRRHGGFGRLYRRTAPTLDRGRL